MKRIQNNLKCILLLVMVFLWIPSNSQAALMFSVNPVEGGNELRFGAIGKQTSYSQEVEVRISSTDGNQYQVFQRLLDPMTNEKGESLNTNVLLTSSIAGSNTMGSLYAQGIDRMSYSDQLIYTSNQDGMIDVFNMEYMVDSNAVDKSGNFFGRILYTVRSTGGGNQDEMVMNVFFEASGNIHVETKTTSGFDEIRLSSKQSQTSVQEAQSIKISFRDNRFNTVKIYQEVIEYPTDELNNEFDLSQINFFTSNEGSGESNYQSATNLGNQRALLYTTDAFEDEFFVNFALSEDNTQQVDTGDFKGKLRYVVEASDITQNIDINLDIEILPIFRLTVDYPEEGMVFGNILPHLEPQIKTCTVEVQSNLNRPYMILQTKHESMMNEMGDEIDNKYFRVKVETLEGDKGDSSFSNFKSVSVGQTTLYTSDSAGSSARFNIYYELAPYPNMKPGNYNATITLSLGEI